MNVESQMFMTARTQSHGHAQRWCEREPGVDCPRALISHAQVHIERQVQHRHRVAPHAEQARRCAARGHDNANDAHIMGGGARRSSHSAVDL